MTTAIKVPTACERENQPRALTEVELSQVTGGGSSTSGADAGKVTLTPFSITKTIDKASPLLF
jgi:type VI protein secretion system component Hcp